MTQNTAVTDFREWLLRLPTNGVESYFDRFRGWDAARDLCARS